MHHPPLYHIAAVALWVLAANAEAGEPTAHVIYPVDYTAQKVQVFEEVEWPLIAPPPIGSLLVRRYCADGQARLLAPRIDGDRLRAVVYVPAYSRLCAEVVALSLDPAAPAVEPDGLERVDLEQDRATLAQIINRVGPLGATGDPAEAGFPAWIGYLLVLLGIAGLALALGFAIVRVVQRLRELSERVRQLQQELAQQIQRELAQQRTVGFVLKELRVESVLEGRDANAKITVFASDGHQERATSTTPQRASILRQLLQRHPEPVSRLNSNEVELINPTELMRLRKDLVPLLGELLALQLIKNSDKQKQVSLNPTLYCPPAKSPPPDA
jgi:hypothetical protein